jgi:1,2-diacylglycerol 3-alpha-glucosyltransferase
MNVLMISDVYFPRVNGVSTSIQTFQRELTALGHEVDLISPAYPAPYAEDGHTLRVASRFVPFDPEDRMMKPRNVRVLLPRLRERRYDLVHIQTFTMYRSCRRAYCAVCRATFPASNIVKLSKVAIR